ncbi:LysR substrate-binding domain-containing protein [Testudinibacter sp. P27/CKL/0425]
MEQIKNLPLKALSFFYFVAEYGSLSAAAVQLNVTHGVVSKQLKLLESYLGTPLWLKQGRNLVLSPNGEILYQSCQLLFGELQSAVRKIQARQQRDLVVSCEPTLAMKWLIPRISAFQQQSGIQPVILAAGGEVDFTRQGIDIAIRRNDFQWSKQLYAEKIVDEQIGLLHSPQLNHTNRLHTHTRPQAWQNWQQLTGETYPQYQGDVFFEHFYLSLQAAIAGMGAAIGSRFMVQDEVAQGILLVPYGFVADGSAYYLLSQTPFDASDVKRTFLRWLRTEMG